MKNFLDLADLGTDDVRALLRRAREFSNAGAADLDRHRQKVLGLLFMNPSLRTLASFQSGMARLGGSSFVVTPGQGTWAFETRSDVVMNGTAAEHVREAIPVIASYAHVVGIRAFAGGVDLEADLAEDNFRAMAAYCPVPLINMESAVNHPCQALADWKTLDDLDVPTDAKFVLSWAYHPKALPLAVPAATVHMAAMRGMNVTVLRPPGFALPDAIMRKARTAAAASGGSVDETDDRDEALRDATVVYAKSWGAPVDYGRPGDEGKRRAQHAAWCVDEDWFEPAAPAAKFMHCLPVRRNVVVTDAVLDGPRSVVIREAENRMWAQMAVLDALLESKRESSN